MTSKAKVASNRANSKLSTGPSEGAKARTRLNGVKHGLRAETMILPGEDPLELDALRETWVNSLRPRDDAEDELVSGVVKSFWFSRRADRAVFEHLKARIEQAEKQAAASVDEDIRRLFSDARGHHCMYATSAATCGGPFTSSPTGDRENPDEPATLVARLESSEKGCLELIGNWRMLRERVEQGLEWQAHDRLKGIRMLGKQPVQAAEDPRVWLIYVGNYALHPAGKQHAFGDFKCEAGTPQVKEFLDRVLDRWPLLLDASDTPKAKQTLLDLVDRNLERLTAKLEVHRSVAAELAASRAARGASDPSLEADRLKRYGEASLRRAHRCLDAFWKYRREQDAERNAEDGGISAEDRGRMTEDRGELGAAEEAAMAAEEKSPSEANVTISAAEAAGLKEVETCKETLEIALAQIAKLHEMGFGAPGTSIGEFATGTAALEHMVFSGKPLLPPVS